MKDVDGDQRQIIKSLQNQVEYLLEKCKVIEEIAVAKNGGKSIVYSDDQKKRLAVKGKRLNEFLLGTIERTFAPHTIFNWYSELVGQKYNSVGPGQKKRGRQPVAPEIVKFVLSLAENNSDWGVRPDCRSIGLSWIHNHGKHSQKDSERPRHCS